MTVVLKTQIQESIDQTAQVERGKDIDQMINEIGKVKFQDLAKDYKRDQLDEARFKKVKNSLMVGSVVLAVAAVIAAIASIIFSSGAAAAGALTIAVASGMVAITPSFQGLDDTIRRYIGHIKEVKTEGNRINKVKKMITDVATLIMARMKSLAHLEEDKRGERGLEILSQITKVNAYITRVKKEVPQKLMDFDYIDPSPILG